MTKVQRITPEYMTYLRDALSRCDLGHQFFFVHDLNLLSVSVGDSFTFDSSIGPHDVLMIVDDVQFSHESEGRGEAPVTVSYHVMRGDSDGFR